MKEKLEEIILNKIIELEIENNIPRKTDEYYLIRDSKLYVLNEILNNIDYL